MSRFFQRPIMASTFLVMVGFVELAQSAETLFTDDVRIRGNSEKLFFEKNVGDTGTWSMTATPDFSIRDEVTARQVVLITEGAPARALFIDAAGVLTASPIDGVNAIMRLRSGAGTGNSIPEHNWTFTGNELAMSISDEETGSTPFTIEDGTQDDTLFLANVGLGHVGIGTISPEVIGNTSTTGNTRHLNLNAGAGLGRAIVQGQTGAESYLVHTGGTAGRKIVRTRVAGSKYLISTMSDDLATNTEIPFSIDLATKNVGVKTASPTKPLQVGDAGANDGNGAHVTAGGVWTDASSRTLKEDIQPVSLDRAREAVRALQPVTYHYKNEADEQYAGFIAEDVPELVATKDRKSLAPMDVAAVLTRVVQEQDRKLEEQQKLNQRYETVIAEQQALLTRLSQRLEQLERKTSGQ